MSLSYADALAIPFFFQYFAMFFYRWQVGMQDAEEMHPRKEQMVVFILSTA